MRESPRCQTHRLPAFNLSFERSEKSSSHPEVIIPARLIKPTKMSSDCD
jgi:hypothetical protein